MVYCIAVLQDDTLLLLWLTLLRPWAQDSTVRDKSVSKLLTSLEHITYRIASSKTLFRFLCVRAEHSRYLCARISFATISAWSYDTGSIRFWRRLSRVPASSLRSSFVPTKMIGTDGAWWSISGNHCSRVSHKTCISVQCHDLP